MYYLVSAVFVEAIQAISISWLEAGIGIITIVITIMGTAWKINRASRQDIESKLVKKVDVEIFEKTCEMQDKEVLHLGGRLTAHESVSESRHEDIKDMFAEIRTDIKDILKKEKK